MPEPCLVCQKRFKYDTCHFADWPSDNPVVEIHRLIGEFMARFELPYETVQPIVEAADLQLRSAMRRRAHA
jgi:hypothetical protein